MQIKPFKNKAKFKNEIVQLAKGNLMALCELRIEPLTNIDIKLLTLQLDASKFILRNLAKDEFNALPSADELGSKQNITIVNYAKPLDAPQRVHLTSTEVHDVNTIIPIN